HDHTSVDLLVKERIEIISLGKEHKKEARIKTMTLWQDRWEQYNGWSKTFIQNVTKWKESKLGEINYYSTQAITGHGVFGSYLKKIKKRNNDDFWFCKAVDTPEHTIFDCQKFTEIRTEAGKKCNTRINKQNISEILTKNQACWNAVTEMLEEIIRSPLPGLERHPGTPPGARTSAWGSLSNRFLKPLKKKKPYTRTKPRDNRLSATTMALLEERRQADRHADGYEALNKTIRKEIRKDLRNHTPNWFTEQSPKIPACQSFDPG
ncbi:hypothetical protein HUJ04_005424, partial [Dendroctonus ponderosae]